MPNAPITATDVFTGHAAAQRLAATERLQINRGVPFTGHFYTLTLYGQRLIACSHPVYGNCLVPYNQRDDCMDIYSNGELRLHVNRNLFFSAITNTPMSGIDLLHLVSNYHSRHIVMSV